MAAKKESLAVQAGEMKTGDPDSIFLRALRRLPVDRTPVWLMRQAGRYQSEYRTIREKVGFLELCKNSQLAAEVTVMAVRQLGVDAGIIFADILLPLDSMGAGVRFVKGNGPVIDNPVKGPADIDSLRSIDPAESLAYVCEAVRLAANELPPAVPLIGFAGAPFTLASYLIEGGSSRHYERTRTFMLSEPEAWRLLMEKLASMTGKYLKLQVASGAGAVQLFDSWAGCLSPDDYQRFVLPHVQEIIEQVKVSCPVIYFAVGASHLLEVFKKTGADAIGIDWKVNLADAWAGLGYDLAVQGNLDPAVLLTDRDVIKDRALNILKEVNGRPGHVFNLGHGVLPATPVDHVKYLVETVHEAADL